MDSYSALSLERLYLQLWFTTKHSSTKLSAHFLKRVNYTQFPENSYYLQGICPFHESQIFPSIFNKETLIYSSMLTLPYLHMFDYNCIRKLLLN